MPTRRWANAGADARPPDRVVTTYDLELLNIESRFELPRIIEALRRRGHGTLCFHGPPGTGKTALAEHIAQALQRPLMVRQASDLVSKYVGETEQNMARMFDEAEAEEAVLLLDEADSFLRSRRLAERNYEVTRSQRDAAGHGALRRPLHLHHQPVRRTRRGRAAPLHVQDPLPGR